MSEARDFVLARLAVTRVSLQAAIEAVDECTAHCVLPDDDADGKERASLLDTAAEALGEATRALEAAQEGLDDDDFDAEEGEDDDEEEEDEDDDEEDEEDEKPSRTRSRKKK
jgi:uncharacterized membrane protein YukC